MSLGYKEHFAKKQKLASIGLIGAGARKAAKPKASAPVHPSKEISVEKLRKILHQKKSGSIRRRQLMPIKALAGFAFVSLLMGIGYSQFEAIEKFLDRVEVSFIGEVSAAQPAANSNSDSKSSDGKSEPSSGPSDQASGAEKSGEGALSAQQSAEASSSVNAATEKTPEEVGHLVRLNDRKKELDAREAELARAEAELELQRQELEDRIKKLEETRTQISSILQERVETDDKKVEDLVQVFSTMKPVQAAKVLETMDEALAVEILGRMKKKPAAEILNLIKAEKAQSISEKYAGYKRKSN